MARWVLRQRLISFKYLMLKRGAMAWLRGYQQGVRRGHDNRRRVGLESTLVARLHDAVWRAGRPLGDLTVRLPPRTVAELDRARYRRLHW